LEQALTEIISNALDAMSDGDGSRSRPISEQSGSADGVLLEITDSGRELRGDPAQFV